MGRRSVFFDRQSGNSIDRMVRKEYNRRNAEQIISKEPFAAMVIGRFWETDALSPTLFGWLIPAFDALAGLQPSAWIAAPDVLGGASRSPVYSVQSCRLAAFQ